MYSHIHTHTHTHTTHIKHTHTHTHQTHTHIKHKWIDTPTVFITRYEYGNLYHTITDWYNTYQLIRTHIPHTSQRSVHNNTHTYTHTHTHTYADDVQIVFLDGHSKGAMDGTWNLLFGGPKSCNAHRNIPSDVQVTVKYHAYMHHIS